MLPHPAVTEGETRVTSSAREDKGGHGPAVFDRIAASLKRMFAAKQPAELVRRRDEG